ncbi:MAG: oligosaccharide flippase family protein [Candidatus Shapirobacteria bacterium]|nr:oligosaccharide flippase family protein [Candidatus Shapirobacteria bacterium]MDD3002701.1 oligosaccharide flippase family protein [Candidatus Shapirobacteria bacterium]MDD4383220.1 oligosaccharide flippase family protein [Candidatus Shapirobacteria bacterium]
MNRLKKTIQSFNSLRKQKFTIDTIWNLASTLILAVSGILMNIVIGNQFKSEGLGVFNQALSIYGVLSIIAVFGVNSSVLKYSAQHKDNDTKCNDLLISSILFTLILSVSLTLLFFFIIPFLPYFNRNPNLLLATRLIILGIPFFSINKILLSFLNGIRKMKSYAVFQSLRWILIIIFIVIIINIKKSIVLVSLSFPLTELLLLISFFIYIKNFFNFNFCVNKSWIKKHMEFGSKSVFINSISELNDKTDILIIGFFMSNYYVGIYSFASSIAKGLLMFSSVIQLNFNPIISYLWGKKKIIKLNHYIKKIKKITLLLTIPIISGAAIFYPFFVNIFMKDKSFLESFSVFYILLIGIGILSIFYWACGLLTMAGYPEKQLQITIIIFIFNIITNSILIPIFGINGAAIANTLSYILIICLIFFISKKKLNIRII